MEKKEFRKVEMGLLVVLLLVLTLSYVSASVGLLCLSDGERVDLAGAQPDYVCSSTSCTLCVEVMSPGVYYAISPNSCNIAGLNCVDEGDGGDDGGVVDTTPPVITISNPIQNRLYDGTRVMLNVQSDEVARLEYKLNDENWKDVCRNGCKIGQSELRASEGRNKVLIRATDVKNNVATKEVEFIVDSQMPKITGSSPLTGYSSGDFGVSFIEANPSELKLKIYYSGGVDSYLVGLNNCSSSSTTKSCNTKINVNKYNGQEIEYSFVLKDIANRIVESGKNKVKVDSSAPVIRSLSMEKEGKNIYFVLNVTEPFLESVEYTDLNDSRSKPKDLCRSVVNGICEGKVALKDGYHTMNFVVRDEAGNVVGRSMSVFVDNTLPKIISSEPKKGYASGEFEIIFKEDYAESLRITYGNLNKGYLNGSFDLGSCTETAKGKVCTKKFDLSRYNGEEIDYYVVLKDKGGNVVESKKILKLKVDTVNPIIKSMNYTVITSRTQFYFNITEANFKEITYIDSTDSRPKEIRLCSKLKDGVCEVQRGFREGDHSLTIYVKDQAGNTVQRNISFRSIR